MATTRKSKASQSLERIAKKRKKGVKRSRQRAPSNGGQAAGNVFAVPETPPRCLGIAQNGIKTSADFASMMSALMSDVIEGKVNASVANATCNAGGKLLKMVELQMRYVEANPHKDQEAMNLIEMD